ncbi:MAG: glycogen/starch synthase [Rhodothermales bacterium]
MRILFVSEEVAPFANATEIAQIARHIPEQLQESGDFEVRIMMPRYGLISERKNRLHEVIRLSGNDIRINGQKEPLKVKVASIPGIRLQVYFMDNTNFFKRKGILSDREGGVFDDNAERAYFFSRSVLQTIRNLGWQPDIVHCLGWLSSLTPLLLRTEFAEDPIFAKARSVYTPGVDSPDNPVNTAFLSELAYPDGIPGPSLSLIDLGSRIADMTIHPPSANGSAKGGIQFVPDLDGLKEQAAQLYEQVLNEVVV